MKRMFPTNPASKHHNSPSGIFAWLLWACLLAACGGESPGLLSVDSTDDCLVGTAGCACYANGTCDPGLECGPGDVCQEPGADTDPECPAGTVDCPCYPNGTCDSGLACNNFGVCQDEETYDPQVPEDPKCYTPCRAGYTMPDQTYVPCPANGLMPGCIGGTVCMEGTCVKPTAVIGSKGPDDPGSCNTDMECPYFQTCIAARCYSNCETNSDCDEPLECHSYVCRQRCTVTTAGDCPAGTSCVNVDGTNGFCLMKAPQNADEQEKQMLGTFGLDRTSLEFTSLVLEHEVVLTNNVPEPVLYTITKVQHTEYDDEGETVVEANPLHWIEMGTAEDSTVDTAFEVLVPAGSEIRLVFTDTGNTELERWSGLITISNEQYGVRRIHLRREANPKGHWTGTMYTFANFGARGLDEWREDKTNPTLIQRVGNAFVKRWIALKQGLITIDEFRAVMSATNEESWKWGSVKARCPNPQSPNPNAGCYLYDNPKVDGDSGIVLYSSDLRYFPVPTAVSALPMAIDIRPDADGAANEWSGRIDSKVALHYAGNPAVTLTFSGDPTTCASSVGGTCIVPLVDTPARPGFLARAVVGGRYLTSNTDSSCSKTAAGDFSLIATPWLVPGFMGPGVHYNSSTGMNHRYECRDRKQPYASAADAPKNLSLAMSNPVPDGRSRSRVLRMVDGAMFNQDTLIIIFEERFASFLSADPGDDFSSYGYMVLTRTPQELAASDYVGSDQSDFRPQPDVLGVKCTSDLLDRVADAVEGESQTRAETIRGGAFENNGVVDTAALRALVEVLLDGRTSTVDPEEYDPADEEIHYFCEDTGLFDDGPDGASPCPLGSRIEFFAVRAGVSLQGGASYDDLRLLPCQENTLEFIYPATVGDLPNGVEDPESTLVLLAEGGSKGTCKAVLDQWRHEWLNNPDTSKARFGLAWECAGESPYCDFDRFDLRDGKRFFSELEEAVAFPSLRYAAREAFAYKTKFQNRSGTSLAFTPAICGSPADAAGYCYDPGAIDDLVERVDCAVHVYTEHYDALATVGTVRGDLLKYLKQNFAYASEPYSPVVHDGFERLYSELLIMQGDEAYTQAFASRFDLAGTQISSFNGADFEPGGINLSGGAGFEMAKLYEATQYYQLALDRLYSMGPALYSAIGEGKGDFITQATVVTWFNKLIRASGQKSRAISRIATRYQGFNRPDLARAVTERGYVAAYMELVILSQLMLEVVETADEEYRDQIVSAIEEAQLRFRQGLLEMRDVYQSITDEVNYFGYPADYVPFPLVDPGDVMNNAALYTIESAKDLAAIASTKEELALQSSREFDTDAAMFMAELNSITYGFSQRLKELCGIFEGDDGQLYAALPENAEKSQATMAMQQVMGTPCGWVGDGAIYEAMMELGKAKLDYQLIVSAQDTLIQEVNIELDRISAQCNEIASLKSITLTNADSVQTAQESVKRTEQAIEDMRRAVDLAGTAADIAANSDIWNGGAPAVLAVGFMAGAVVTEVISYILQDHIVNKQNEIADLEQATIGAGFDSQCAMAEIDSLAVIKEKLLGMGGLELEALKVQYDVQLAMSRVQGLRNQVRDTLDEMATAQQMLIDVAAAHNNPNTRIYKNDAVLAADRTFERAIGMAYEATKVFEYYTSQTYAHRDSLFLVRLVQYGDYSLEAYIEGLEDAYYGFTYDYGIPDERVAVVSLRDDVLKIPYIGEDSMALGEAERIALFRERLLDAKSIDGSGYRAFPFSTGLDRLSPLTRNHKVTRMKVELLGADTGDDLGRVYLRQRGTGVVRGVDEQKRYFSFPERTAVIDTFFNGAQPFYQNAQENIYESWRFKDRPFVNTQWDAILNQKDEYVNMDIDLASLSDIRLFIYYSDFTVF
jgi:hypothetical protein